MRDLRVAFWTNKGDFALCGGSKRVSATQTKNLDVRFLAFAYA